MRSAPLIELRGDDWSLRIEGPPPTFAPGVASQLTQLEVTGDAKVSAVQGEASTGEAINPLLCENFKYVLTLEGPEGITLSGLSLIEMSRTGVANRHAVAYSLQLRNQVGLWEVTVQHVQGRIASAAIEVFPTKLDYRTDFVNLRDEVADLHRSLVHRATSATTSAGAPVGGPASLTEWAANLRALGDEIIDTVAAITVNPDERLAGDDVIVRAERLRKHDVIPRHSYRRLVAAMHLDSTGQSARAVRVTRRTSSRDTPSNRWLLTQLGVLRHRLRWLTLEGQKPVSREDTALQIFARALGPSVRPLTLALDQALANPVWSQVNRRAQIGDAPLESRSDYRRAAQLFRALRSGIALGSPGIQVGLEDIARLYEAWVFLKVVDVLAKVPSVIVSHVRLMTDEVGSRLSEGFSSAVRLRHTETGQEIRVIYNARFSNLPTTLQRPDVWVEAVKAELPALLLDAKYRLAWDPSYVAAYGGVGPPVDTINTMHRYRDAIVNSAGNRLTGTAVVVFPAMDPLAFKSHQFSLSIGRVGVGAVAALPAHYDALAEVVLDWCNRLLGEALKPEAFPDSPT